MPVHLAHVTFDCSDAAALAEFWSELVGQPIDEGASEHFATVGKADGGVALMFIHVAEPKSTKNRVHVDLHTSDLEGEVARAVDLGATQVGNFDEYGARWVTLLDPQGNEFDIGAS